MKTAIQVGRDRWRICDPTMREITVMESKEQFCERLFALDLGDGRASSLAKEIRLNGEER